MGADARALSAQLAGAPITARWPGRGRPPRSGGIACMTAEGGEGRPVKRSRFFSALVLVDITPRVDLDGVAQRCRGFNGASTPTRAFASVRGGGPTPSPPTCRTGRGPRSNEGLKEEPQASPRRPAGGWHWEPSLPRWPAPGRAGGAARSSACWSRRRSASPSRPCWCAAAASELVKEEHAKGPARPRAPTPLMFDVTGARQHGSPAIATTSSQMPSGLPVELAEIIISHWWVIS